MGSIYYLKNQKSKRWRVQIRNRGFKYISCTFETEKEAKEFLRKANKKILKKREKRATKNALKRLTEKV